MKYFLCIFLITSFFSMASADAKENIWDVKRQQFISKESLYQKIFTAQNILLGIEQDNPQHHKLVASILKKLVFKNRKPILLLGNIERDKQNAFAIFRQRHLGNSEKYNATGLDMLLSWATSGQPKWSIVSPPFHMAMLKNIPLIAAAFSRYETGNFHRNNSLPDDIKDDLLPLLAKPVPENVKHSFKAEITKSYCIELPPKVMERTILLERGQNGLFALEIHKLNRMQPTATTVLLTGQKNILTDIGVPVFLDQLKSKGKTISLSFMEENNVSLQQNIDYVWYTDSVSRPSPCLNK